MTATKKKETAAQVELRKAQELVQKAKKAEQDAWQAKWKAQRQDPEYKRKQAERWAKSEERSRKIAIGKENKQLAQQAKLQALLTEKGWTHKQHEEHAAIHEAGHAVVIEILGNGVQHATILPRATKDSVGLSLDKIEVGSTGHVLPNSGSLSVLGDEGIVYEIAGLKAGGQATANAGYQYFDEYGETYNEHGDEYNGDNGGRQLGVSKDEEMVDEALKKVKSASSISLWQAEYRGAGMAEQVLDDPKAWAACEEIAQGLLTEKTLSCADVRTIVKKHMHPELGIKIDIGRQYSFHYRKNRQHTYTDGVVPYTLGIGDYHYGYSLSQPSYVKETEDKTKDMKKVLFPASYQHQLPLFSMVILTTPQGREIGWKAYNEGQVKTKKTKRKNTSCKETLRPIPKTAGLS